MRKMIIVLGLIAILTACSTVSTSANKEERFTEEDMYLTITTDKETGCKYIVFERWAGSGGAGGISPLMLPDGTQDCK